MSATERATYLAAHPGAESLAGLGTLDSNDYNLTSSDGQLNLANWAVTIAERWVIISKHHLEAKR